MFTKRRLTSSLLWVVGAMLASTILASGQSTWDATNWRIQNRIGIGTDTPADALHINFGPAGSIRARTPLGNGPGWTFYAPNGNRRDIVGWIGGVYITASPNSDHGPATSAITIQEDGNVGIGMQDSATNVLTVRRNSPTDPIADAWTVYSSKLYKQDISPLTEVEYQQALQALLGTQVVRFRYQGQPSDAKEKIGVLAEDAPPQILAESDPRAVSLQGYISLLHAAIKAQQDLIDAQEEQIADLQARMIHLMRDVP